MFHFVVSRILSSMKTSAHNSPFRDIRGRMGDFRLRITHYSITTPLLSFSPTSFLYLYPYCSDISSSVDDKQSPTRDQNVKQNNNPNQMPLVARFIRKSCCNSTRFRMIIAYNTYPPASTQVHSLAPLPSSNSTHHQSAPLALST